MAYVNILELVYPVGSIYISINEMSPAEIIGGTWQKIENKFLYATTDASNIYDGADIHKHTLSLRYAGYYRELGSMSDSSTDCDNFFSFYNEETKKYTTVSDVTYDANQQSIMVNGSTTKATSEGTARIYQLDTTLQASNLPAYYAVYMWVRTA